MKQKPTCTNIPLAIACRLNGKKTRIVSIGIKKSFLGCRNLFVCKFEPHFSSHPERYRFLLNPCPRIIFANPSLSSSCVSKQSKAGRSRTLFRIANQSSGDNGGLSGSSSPATLPGSRPPSSVVRPHPRRHTLHVGHCMGPRQTSHLGQRALCTQTYPRSVSPIATLPSSAQISCATSRLA